MTFNVWQAGANVNNGFYKILSHIKAMNPDILLLQEGSPSLAIFLEHRLGGPEQWNVCRSPFAEKNYIFTQFRIVRQFDVFNSGQEPLHIGCQLEVQEFPQLLVNVWNMHMYWGYYGPYIACDRHVDDPYLLYMGERAGEMSMDLNKAKTGHDGRLTEIVKFFNYEPVWGAIQDAEADFLSKPMIIGGDFNSPSHQDWVESVAPNHCGWYYQWPVSSLLNTYRFVDTYRAAHPDPKSAPGTTWSTVFKYSRRFLGVFVPEPQDRIDYIFIKDPSKRLTVEGSWVYEGNETIAIAPNYINNDWPSDHAAVVTDFAISI